MDGNNNGWGPWWNVPIGPEHELPIGRNATGQAIRKLWPRPGEWYGPGSDYGHHLIRHWTWPMRGVYAELCRRLDAMDLVIVDPRSVPVRIRGAGEALLAIHHSEHSGQNLVVINPIDRLFGQRHGSPEVRAIMAEAARQVASMWHVMPRTCVGLAVYYEPDHGLPFDVTFRDVVLRVVMWHNFPEVGPSQIQAEARLSMDVVEDIDPCFAGALFYRFTNQLVGDVQDWARANGGRTWQPIVESRRDMEAERYGEVCDD